MVEKIAALLSAFVIATISSMGYGGVVLLMAIESACIPLPSEVVMPFAGYLVSTGHFGLQTVAIAGSVGCLLGSLVAYAVGRTGGRHAFEHYGRYLLISPHELELADHFFMHWGAPTVFFGRMLPVIRTFIAFPAGVARMGLWRFSLYTLLGSYPWCLGLAYAGMELGVHWKELGPYFRRFDNLIAVLGLLAVGLFIYHRVRAMRAGAALSPSQPS